MKHYKQLLQSGCDQLQIGRRRSLLAAGQSWEVAHNQQALAMLCIDFALYPYCVTFSVIIYLCFLSLE